MKKPIAWIALLVACSSSLLAQWPKYKEPGVPRDAEGRVLMEGRTPRTPDGKPDLSGTWESQGYFGNLGKDLKPGELLMQPWAEALVQQRREDLEKDYMNVLCLPLGPGYSTAQRYVKIIQTPTVIVMLDEDLSYRQIYLDGRALELFLGSHARVAGAIAQVVLAWLGQFDHQLVVLAVVVRLLELTHFRVGNEEYAQSNHSYGLTTLRDGHARIDGIDPDLRPDQRMITFMRHCIRRSVSKYQALSIRRDMF